MSEIQHYEDSQVEPAREIRDFGELDAILMGAPPAAQFKEPGALVIGTITRVIARQATDFQTKEPKYWPSGDPVLEAVVTLDTQDGPANVYVNSRGMREAIKNACRQANVGLRPGGQLAIRYTGNGEPFGPGATPPKLYDVAYDPPSSLARKIEQDKAQRAASAPLMAVTQGQDPPF